MTLAQQYEVLHQVANEHTRVTLNFEALGLALKTSLASSALKKIIDNESSTAGVEQDPDERESLFQLMEEQAERAESIIKAEDERLKKELELLDAKCQLVKEFDILREEYSLLLDGNPDLAPASKRQKSTVESNLVEQKTDVLKAEEDRVVQMKTMIQKLMFANPHGCLNYDDEVKNKHQEMLLKCGEDLSTLRSGKLNASK